MNLYKKIIAIFLCLLIICLFCKNIRNLSSQKLTEHDGNEMLSSYINVLSAGDSTRVKHFWSKKSSEKKGFWMMQCWIGSHTPFKFWKSILNYYTYEIDGINHENNYNIINLKWIPKKENHNAGHPVRQMRFYVTKENNRWIFINPVDILTENWITYETGHLSIHFPENVNINDYKSEIEYIKSETDKIISFFNLELKEKIHYYFARSPEECGELFLQRGSNGYAAPWIKTAVSTTFDNLHEVIHVLDNNAGFEANNYALDEGIAVAFGGATKSTPDFAVNQTRNFIEDCKYIPLKKLLTNSREFFTRNFITYFESGALIRFLFEKYGIVKLRELYRVTRSSKNVFDALQKTYNHTLVELESQFKEYILSLEIPKIISPVPQNAYPIFSMKDPMDDDKGDGDYSYTFNRFEKGVFDLIKFEIFKGENDVYFRLKFNSVYKLADYQNEVENFFPGAVIAINSGDVKNTRKILHGIELKNPGYNIKINIGDAVSLTNNLGKLYFSTPFIWNKITDKSKNTIEFSLPITFVGEPSKEWRYFVGTGLMSDRSMNFTDAGLMRVMKDGPPYFIKGGNFNYGNPCFMDILLPEKLDQIKLLSRYNPEKGIRALIPMVGIEN